MKNLNFNNLVKDKLTGEEIGKLMLKDCLSVYISALKDKDVLEGRKEPETLLKEHEIKQLIQNLSGDYNIKIYNNYRELIAFTKDLLLSQVVDRYEIEVGLWKLAFCFFARDRIPITPEDIPYLKKSIMELNEHIKEFLFYTAVFQLIAEFTKVSEVLYIATGFPSDLVKIINTTIEGYNLANKVNLPMLEVKPISKEIITQALEEITDISILFDKDRLKELLMVEEVCV